MIELTRGEKLRRTMIRKHGSLEAWKKAMQENGRKGGMAERSVPTGFAAMSPERRKELGRRGGLNRGKSKAV